MSMIGIKVIAGIIWGLLGLIITIYYLIKREADIELGLIIICAPVVLFMGPLMFLICNCTHTIGFDKKNNCTKTYIYKSRILTKQVDQNVYDAHRCGSMFFTNDSTCTICRKCLKVLSFSDHCSDDTDEIELSICEDCLKVGLLILKNEGV